MPAPATGDADDSSRFLRSKTFGPSRLLRSSTRGVAVPLSSGNSVAGAASFRLFPVFAVAPEPIASRRRFLRSASSPPSFTVTSFGSVCFNPSTLFPNATALSSLRFWRFDFSAGSFTSPFCSAGMGDVGDARSGGGRSFFALDGLPYVLMCFRFFAVGEAEDGILKTLAGGAAPDVVRLSLKRDIGAVGFVVVGTVVRD